MVSIVFLVAGLVATVALLVGSAFFSSSEIAVFSLQPSWIEEQASSGERRERVLGELRSDPHRLLVTLLVGNNVMNIAIGSILTVLLVEVFSPGPAVMVATLVSSFIVLVFGEIVPKSFGLGNAERWATAVAVPIWVAQKVMAPLVVPLDWLTSVVTERLGADPRIEDPMLP